MITKCSFIIFTACFSSVMIMSFSTGVIFVALEPLSLQYDLKFFQNILFSAASLTLFRMNVSGTAHGCGGGGGKKPPPPHKLCHTYPTMVKLGWHSYALSAEDPKTIWIRWHTPWVLLTSAFFVNFAVSRNTDIDSISIHSF